MNRLYERLKNDEFFKDKLDMDDSKNRLTITFHEYLYLIYIEGNYKAANDEGVILFQNDLTHWHITDDDEALEIVIDLANGDVICIESKLFFLPFGVRFMKKEKFEKKKERYMKKKFLRIYTGNEIIKRHGK